MTLKTMNNSASSSDEEDYFARMFEPVQNKIVLTLLYLILEIIGTTAISMILAYDASRTELRRTLINSISNTFFLSQIWFINGYCNTPPIIRIWLGPLPLWFAQLHQQIVIAISLYNIMLILEYVVVKYVFACKLKSPGSHLDDLLSPFVVAINILLTLMALASFIMLDTWPTPIRIAILSGINPKHMKINSSFDPGVVVNTTGSIATATGILAAVSIHRERIKIRPLVKPVARDARTGLPIQPRAQPIISLRSLLVTSVLVICFVMVPAILAKYKITDPEVLKTSEFLSLIYGCLTLFGFAVIALLALPALVFASDSKLRTFAVRKLKCML